MKATTNLENDHVHILKLCDAMERIAHEDDIDLSKIEVIVKIIRGFADGLHHKKEEEFLFPKMAEKGFSLHSGPVAVMLNDHQEGRSCVKGIADGITACISGDNGGKKVIKENMLAYVNLLRNHISKENNVLFRMADNCLSAEEQQALLNEFVKAENSLNGRDSVDDYISGISTL